jgi:hypothetical protein
LNSKPLNPFFLAFTLKLVRREYPGGGFMGPKLLFLLGIVAVHAALGAAWLEKEAPKERASLVSCGSALGPEPDFTPRRELLAMTMFVVDPAGLRP